MTTLSPEPTPTDAPVSEHTILYLTMWGTIGTAVFTLLLAGFALAAWLVSRSSAKHMERQVQETEKAAQRQIADQAWGRQIDALSRYLRLLHEFQAQKPALGRRVDNRGNVTDDARVSLSFTERAVAARQEHRKLERELRSAGSIWRLSHREPKEAVWQMEEIEDRIVDAFWDASSLDHIDERWVDAVSAFIETIQEWQAVDDKASYIEAVEAGVLRWLDQSYDSSQPMPKSL